MDKAKADNFISAASADKLISAHDGDVALLYIYLARTGTRDMEQAAHDLCRTMGEITAAEEKLRRMNLIPGEAAAAPARAKAEYIMPKDELPQYLTADITRHSMEDEKFSVILAEATRVIGHALSSVDIKILFGIYDYLALPAEVVLELLNYCAECCFEKYQNSRKPTAKNIEKEAYIWANREVTTLEQAEEYIRFQKARRSDMGRIKENLGIHGRDLTPTEQRYISSWLDMGFEDEAIAIAYDRTVTNTGGLKWSYMNKILESWKENDLLSAQEIEEKDGKRRPAAPARPGGKKAISMDELRSIADKI